MAEKLKTGTVRAAANPVAAATFVPDSFKEAERTIDVVFGTDKPVLMGWWEPFYEILSFDRKHVRMDRLNSGAPMLDTHNRYSGVSKQPGVVDKAWVKEGKGYATLRFANDEDGEKIMKKVKDGIVRNISVGYTVFAYEEVDAAGTTSGGAAKENKIRTLKAVDWEPSEISFVPVPADHTAGVRAAGEKPPHKDIEVLQLNQDNMRISLKRDAGAHNNGGGAEPDTATPPAGGTEQNRAAAPPAAAPATPPAAPEERAAPPAAAPATQPPAADAGLGLRVMQMARKHNFSLEEIEGFVGAARSEDHARSLILTALEARDQGTATHSANRSANVQRDERDKVRSAMEGALTLRALGGNIPKDIKLGEGYQEYRNMDLMDMARESVERSMGTGASRTMSKRQIAMNALNIGPDMQRGAMSTSDFPLILGNLAHRTVLTAYQEQESNWRPIGRQKNATDFKQMTMVKLSEGGDFQKVNEGGEYKRTVFSEAGDTHRVLKYGEIVAMTWEMIQNDDMGIFTDILPKLAAHARRKQADIVWDLLLGGAGFLGSKTYDGKQLFHADHNNTVTAAAIGINSLGAMRAQMRKQKGLDGKARLELNPKFMLVGPDNEQLMMQYTSNAYVPNTAGEINVWKGLVQPIVEPRFDDYDPNASIMVADPRSADTLIYSFLEGEEEMFTEQRTGFDIDGLEIKARMVFGAKVVDWRGFVRNAGA